MHLGGETWQGFLPLLHKTEWLHSRGSAIFPAELLKITIHSCTLSKSVPCLLWNVALFPEANADHNIKKKSILECQLGWAPQFNSACGREGWRFPPLLQKGFGKAGRGWPCGQGGPQASRHRAASPAVPWPPAAWRGGRADPHPHPSHLWWRQLWGLWLMSIDRYKGLFL